MKWLTIRSAAICSNEPQQGKDVQAISETNVFIYRDLASASAGSLLCGPGISRRTLSEEHVPLWAQTWFTNDVRNPSGSELVYFEGFQRREGIAAYI